MEVWGALLNGGCIVVIDQEALLDPDRFGRELEKTGVTALFLTTSLFNRYVGVIPEALGRLRFLLSGGEKSEPLSFARALENGGPQHLIHCYGPTETTTFAATCEIREVPPGATTIPIGRPIANTRIYILDRFGTPAPIGVPGEIHIGGDGVASGYLNRPDLTAERFLPSPFVEGDRLYRTGDLGRYLADGTIAFLGRNDSQIKIRGFRVELKEIEARLLQHPGVREAAVVARQDAAGDKSLAAYYVVEPGVESVGAESLRRTIAAVLPDLHGSGGLCAAGRVAADRERQAGREGLAGSGRRGLRDAGA